MTRSRSCFVVGEISRVTVWFVSGGYISCTPAVVNVSSTKGEKLSLLNTFIKNLLPEIKDKK